MIEKKQGFIQIFRTEGKEKKLKRGIYAMRSDSQRVTFGIVEFLRQNGELKKNKLRFYIFNHELDELIKALAEMKEDVNAIHRRSGESQTESSSQG
jgi:hypothetical protein